MQSSTPLTEGNNQIVLTNHKYQKAIKQINKLILINTNAKKEYASLQEKYSSLQLDYQSLESKFKCLDREIDSESNAQGIPKLGKQLDSFDETSQMLTNSGNYFTIIQRKPRDSNLLSIPCKSLENTGTLSEYIEKNNKLEDYEQKIAEKEQKISELMKQLTEKNIQNNKLFDKCVQLTCSNQKKKEEQTKPKMEEVQNYEQIKHVRNQLQKCQKLVSQLSHQIERLKKITQNVFKTNFCHSGITKMKSLGVEQKNQYRTQSFKHIHSESHPQIQHFETQAKQQPEINPIKNLDSKLCTEEYESKIKALQSEMQKIKKTFSHKKWKYKAMIAELGKQNDNMNKFISKQQSFIEEFFLNHKNLLIKRTNFQAAKQKTQPSKFKQQNNCCFLERGLIDQNKKIDIEQLSKKLEQFWGKKANIYREEVRMKGEERQWRNENSRKVNMSINLKTNMDLWTT